MCAPRRCDTCVLYSQACPVRGRAPFAPTVTASYHCSGGAKRCRRYTGMMPCRRCADSNVIQRLDAQLRARAFVRMHLGLPSSRTDAKAVPRLHSRALCMSRAPQIRRARVAQEAGISALSTCDGVALVICTVGRVTVRLDTFVGSQWGLVHASRATTLGQNRPVNVENMWPG